MVTPKTHTAIVLRMSENIAFGQPEGVEWVVETTIGGQLQPSNPQATLTKYGLDIQKPYEWFGDDDPAPVEMGDRLEINGELYQVMSAPKIWDAVAVTAHYAVALEAVD